MAVDVSGFVSRPEGAEGLYAAANIIRQNRAFDQDVAQEKERTKQRNVTQIANYLDPKDYLTGTAYDPKVVEDIDGVMKEAMQLNSSGADISTVMTAIMPKVSKINEYSQKAKIINANIKNGVAAMKAYPGYNMPAIEQEARKSAFYNEDGTLRDLGEVDPNADWITETVKTKPWAVTSASGIDELVGGLPMEEFSGEVTTSNKGINRKVRVGGKKAFYEDYATDEKGNAILDANGNPVGLEVKGSTPLKNEKGQVLINPDTRQPFRSMDRAAFFSIMQERPDIADYIRGRVDKYYRDNGQTPPQQNEEAWENTARAFLGDELRMRKKSAFRVLDQETKNARVQAMEAGLPIGGKGGGKKGSGEGESGGGGHVFDEFNLKIDGGGRIENGKVFDKDSKPMGTSEKPVTLTVQPSAIPGSVIASIRKAGLSVDPEEPMKVKVVDGDIVSVKPISGQEVSRSLANIGLGNLDTSPKEVRSKSVGNTQKPPTQKSSGKPTLKGF